MADLKATLIYYESPYRILKTLNDLLEVFPERDIVVAKELTKKFERIFRGKAAAIIAELSTSSVKGEFVLLIQGNMGLLKNSHLRCYKKNQSLRRTLSTPHS